MSDDDLRAALARIEARLVAVERNQTLEHADADKRGDAQSAIGERVATLEANMKHVLRTLDSLGFRAGVAATGGAGSTAGVLWLVFGGG